MLKSQKNKTNNYQNQTPTQNKKWPKDLQTIKNIQTRNEDYDKLKHNSKHNKIYLDSKKKCAQKYQMGWNLLLKILIDEIRWMWQILYTKMFNQTK